MWKITQDAIDVENQQFFRPKRQRTMMWMHWNAFDDYNWPKENIELKQQNMSTKWNTYSQKNNTLFRITKIIELMAKSPCLANN
jgi:hypothetical protein